MAELTAKHRAFIAEYMKDKNGTQAAIRAGYSERTANEQAARLLANVSVRAEIERLLNQVTEKAMQEVKISKQWVIEQLVENVRMAKAAEPVVDASGASTGEYRTNIPAANKALELLGKELGMFVDRVEKGKPGEFDRLDDAEIEKRLIENERALVAARAAIGKASSSARTASKSK